MLYNIFRETVFCGDSYKRGPLPEFIILFLSLRAGEVSGMVPGKLPNGACFSRLSGLLPVSSGTTASFWGLPSSLEWVPPTSACEKGMAPRESQDFLEDGFLEDGHNITRSALRIFSRLVPVVEADRPQLPGDISLLAGVMRLRTLSGLSDPGVLRGNHEGPYEMEAEGDAATEVEKGMHAPGKLRSIEDAISCRQRKGHQPRYGRNSALEAGTHRKRILSWSPWKEPAPPTCWLEPSGTDFGLQTSRMGREWNCAVASHQVYDNLSQQQ